jgi:hypothetical protein
MRKFLISNFNAIEPVADGLQKVQGVKGDKSNQRVKRTGIAGFGGVQHNNESEECVSNQNIN